MLITIFIFVLCEVCFKILQNIYLTFNKIRSKILTIIRATDVR